MAAVSALAPPATPTTTTTSSSSSSDKSRNTHQPYPPPADTSVPPPSESTCVTLTLLGLLARAPAADPATGLIPVAEQEKRAVLYEELYQQLKPSGGHDDETGGTDIPPSPDSSHSVQWIQASLPLFFQQCLRDIEGAAGPRHASSTHAQFAASAAASAALAALPAPRRCDKMLARTAVKCLGYFLHHPSHLSCFPTPRATEALRKRASQAAAAATAAHGDHADAASVASPSDASVSSDPPADGFDVLASVLSRTRDSNLACMLCWLYAEQTLIASALEHYVDGAIDAFEEVARHFQLTAASVAAVPATSTPALASGSRAASPVLPPSSPHTSPSALNQEIVQALFKFARLCTPALRARALRNDPARPEPLRWLQVLVIEPYLNPTAFYACSTAPMPAAAAVAAATAAAAAAPAAVPVPSSVSSATSSSSGSSFSKEELPQRTRLRQISMELVRVVLDGCFLSRHAVPASPGVLLFARGFHARASGGASSSWVKGVTAEVAARVALIEAERVEGRRLEKEAAARARDRDMVKIEGAAPRPAAAAAVAAAGPSAASARYEQRLSALYLETFQLLRLYLSCTGPLLASASSSGSGGGASPPPINAFLTFIQPLFSSPCVAVRSIVFPEMWAYVCRALSADEKARQDEEDTAFAAAAAAAAGGQDRKPQSVAVVSTAAAASKPLSASSAAASRRFLALVMKPFAHHLPKDPSPLVVGSLLRTWLAFVAEHFLSALPAPAKGAPNLAPGAPHRIGEKYVYEEVMARLIALLAPSSSSSSSASAGAGAGAQQRSKPPKLTFEEHWDSHARAAVWEQILEAWKSATSGNAFSADPSAEAPPPTAGSTATHSTSGDSSMSSSTGSTLPQTPQPPALLYLPALVHALLDQLAASPTRAAFVQWATGAVARVLSRIQGNTEKKALMDLYLQVLRSGVKAQLQTHRVASMSAALALRNQAMSMSGGLGAALPSSSSASSSASASAPSMLHVLFQSWQLFMSGCSQGFAQQLRSAQASSGGGGGGVLPSNKAQKHLFWAGVQWEVLQTWLHHRAPLDAMRNLDLAGPVLTPPSALAPSASDAGYNATPTPLSAPFGGGGGAGGGGSGAGPQLPPMSSFLSSMVEAWFGYFAPFLAPAAQTALGPSAAEPMRERFLEGLGALGAAHLERVQSHQGRYNYHNNNNRVSGMQCLQGLLESLLRTYAPQPTHSGLCALLWQVQVHCHTLLLRHLVPQAAHLADGDSQAPGSPSFGPSGASLESAPGGAVVVVGGGGGGAAHSTGGGSTTSSSAAHNKSSKEWTVVRVANSLADMALQHMSEEADAAQSLWLHDPAAAAAARAAFEASEAARADQAVEMLVQALLLPTRLPALATAALDSPAASSPNGVLGPFFSASTLLAQLSLFSSDDDDDHDDGPSPSPLPDVMALLTSSMLDTLRDHGAAATPSGFSLVLRLALAVVEELHATRAGGGGRIKSSPPPSASSTPLSNWKQWKGHAHAGLQKVVNALLENAVRRGLERTPVSASASAPAPASDAMVDVSAPSTTQSSLSSASEAGTLSSLLNGLVALLSRLPSGGSSLDGVAWLLRLMPSFHAWLSALNAAARPGGSTSPASTAAAATSLVADAARLWSAALSAFRNGWQGRAYDFGLLQEVVAKIPVATPAPAATVASAVVAASLPTTEVLFIDMLTLSLSHSHAGVRSATLQFWTHSFAVRRSASSVSPLARLHFHAHPEFVAVCRARCDAGELQEWQVPLTAAQQAEATAAAQAAAARVPTAPSSMQSSPQHHLLVSPSAGAGAVAIVPSVSAASAAGAGTGPNGGTLSSRQQSWAALCISPTRVHFEQHTSSSSMGGAAAADAVTGDQHMADADDMGLTGMMNDAAADADAEARTAGSVPVSAEKSLRIPPSILSSPPPPSTPAAAGGSAIGPSPSSTTATSSGGGGGAGSGASGAFSSSHSFLPSNRFSKRRTNLLERMAAVAPELPSDLVAAPASMQGAAASPPARPERMERTASQDQAALDARQREQKEQHAEGEMEVEVEASDGRRDTLSPFPATPARATAASQQHAPPLPSLSGRLLSEFDQAAAADADAEAGARAAAMTASTMAVVVAASNAASSQQAVTPAQPDAAVPATALPSGSEPLTRTDAGRAAAAVTATRPSPPPPAPPSAPAATLAPPSAATSASEDIAQSLSLPMCSSISQPQAHAEADGEEGDGDAEGDGDTDTGRQRGTASADAAQAKEADSFAVEQQTGGAAVAVVAADDSARARAATLLSPSAPADQLRTHSQPGPPSARTAKQPIILSEPILSAPPLVAAPSQQGGSAHASQLEAHAQPFVPPILPAIAAAPAGTPVATDARPAVTEPAAADEAATVTAPARQSDEREESKAAAASEASMEVDGESAASSSAASASPLPRHTGTKRALDSSVAPASPPSKRVVFSEGHNVAISPSPLFSTLSPSTGSIGASSSAAAGAAGGDADADADADPHMEKGTSEGSGDSGGVVHFNLTPLSPLPAGGNNESKSHGAVPPALTRAEKAQQRADALQLHAEKKAQLKLRANPAGSSDAAKASVPAPILKRPASMQAGSDKGPTSTVAASSATAAATAPGAASLHPSLSGSLAPLSHLLSCFATAESSQAFGALFASLRLMTVGDVAACTAERVRAGVDAAPSLLDGCLPLRQQKGERNADADSTATAAVQLVRDALAAYEEKQLKPQRKRKQPATSGSSTEAAPAPAVAAAVRDESTSGVGAGASLPPSAAAAAADEKTGESPAPKKAKVTSATDPGASANQTAHPSANSKMDYALDSAHVPPAATAATVVAAAADGSAFVSMPAAVPASLSKQLSTSRASSFSASELSCGSGGLLSNSSPVIPFVAPEFTSVVSAALPSATPIRPAPQAASAAAAPPTHDSTAAAGPPAVEQAPQSASQTTPPSDPPASTSSAAAFVAPALDAAALPSETGAAAAVAPQVSEPPPPASASAAAAAPSHPHASPPSAALAAGATATGAAMAVDVDMGELIDGGIDALEEEEDAEDSGPLGVQMGRLRFHLCSSMSTLFAPVHPAHLPVSPHTPMHSGHGLTSPSAAPAAPGLAVAAHALLGSNVVAELSLTQLREIASYVQSMQVAVQKQLRRRERSEAIAFSRRESLVTPSRMLQTRRTDSAAPQSPQP